MYGQMKVCENSLAQNKYKIVKKKKIQKHFTALENRFRSIYP